MHKSTVYQSIVAVILTAFLVIQCGCPPVDPNPERTLPQGTSCSSVVIACYNEFARMPANLICFLPTSRWDKIDLTWQLVNPLPGIDPLDQEEEVERAFKSWSDFSALTFSQVASDADIVISFETLIHGDDFPFEDDGSIIGHAYFPGSPQPGDIHLNNSKSWALIPADEQIDLYTVALHEIGHALGLEHSLNPGAIMAPVYVADGLANITNIDVAAIRRLYGSEDGNIPPVPNNTPENFCVAPDLLLMGDPDSDGDGIPDTYEVFALGTNPFSQDSDGDGVNDLVEVFIDGTPPNLIDDPNDVDSDGDGLTDIRENQINTDPNNPDSDGDTLSDGDEVIYLGTDPNLVDTDGDGFNDAIDPFPTNKDYPVDCNGNIIADSEDLISGVLTDCDGNGVPDECESNPCDDGLFCNGVEICDGEECVAGDVPCTSNEICNEGSQQCFTISAPGCTNNNDCDDGVPCTFNVCNNGGVCEFPPVLCLDDGDFCNGVEQCVDGECESIDPPCLDHQICDNKFQTCFNEILFVKMNARGENNGSSWSDAFTDLQSAIAIAPKMSTVTQIWVAEGVYKPAPPDSNRAISFSLLSGISIYGGFVGGETSLDQRDPSKNDTILSGDLNGDDQGFVNNTENSYHVVNASNVFNFGELEANQTTIQSGLSFSNLDGFIITGGNADDNKSKDFSLSIGGGLYSTSSEAIVTNCLFTLNSAYSGGGCIANIDGGNLFLSDTICINNIATGDDSVGQGGGFGSGGGIYNQNSNPFMVRCRLESNTAAFQAGGMYNVSSSPTLNNCVFEKNITQGAGGGMINQASHPTLNDCNFLNNQALGGFSGGGGMKNVNSNPSLNNCTFDGNEVADLAVGGGISNLNSNPTMNQCTFTGNTASAGGGMYNDDSSPTAIDCTFTGNQAISDISSAGGGIYNFKGSPIYTNCIFDINTASASSGKIPVIGGGLVNDTTDVTYTNCLIINNSVINGDGGGSYSIDSAVTMNNCTITENSSGNSSAIINDGTNILVMNNSILWGNIGNSIDDEFASISSIYFSNIQGGWKGTGSGNIDTDPMFVGTGDFQLSPGSICIDAGDSDRVPFDIHDLDNDGNTTELIPIDLAGNPRILDDPGSDRCPQIGGDCGLLPVDMGAYEFVPEQ